MYKRNLLSLVAVGVLLGGVETIYASQNSVWTTSYGELSININNKKAVGAYTYAKGAEITGEFQGTILYGYWKEDDNTDACGPNNEWDGTIAFSFSSDGKSFTGTWSECTSSSDTPYTLNPNEGKWNGTLKEGQAITAQSLMDNNNDTDDTDNDDNDTDNDDNDSAACEPATVDEQGNISIPKATVGIFNVKAELSFVGQDKDGKLLWKLESAEIIP